ncbi:unnamed protein product [Mytilus coruscus]|uniref:TIR domain-containing protein n=1 Tax=Mytilus coruscus TaxID=42192 RepID=A0A6J8AB24_MYTCO|nr:unnamed protein product [Mytilus coruscus]
MEKETLHVDKSCKLISELTDKLPEEREKCNRKTLDKSVQNLKENLKESIAINRKTLDKSVQNLKENLKESIAINRKDDGKECQAEQKNICGYESDTTLTDTGLKTSYQHKGEKSEVGHLMMLKILSDSIDESDFSHNDFLPDKNNNANRPQTESCKTPPRVRPKDGERNCKISNPIPCTEASRNLSPLKGGSLHNVENERLSLSGLVRVLGERDDILDIKHIKDLEYIWNCIKPDKKEGKKCAAVEMVVKADYNIIFKNCLKHLKDVDFEQTDSFKGWHQVKSMLNVAWMLSDSSPLFCKQTIDDTEALQNLHNIMRLIIECDMFEENKNLKYIIKAFLGILHNTCRHCSNFKECLRSCPFLSVMLRLSKTKIAMIRAKCLIVMSYIVNDSEIHVVSTDCKVLVFIIEILKNAKCSDDHMSYKYGMNVSEILHGLNNLLANDENKEKLMSLEVLMLYLEILSEKFSDEEVCLTVVGIWKLSFHDSNKGKMKMNSQLLEELGRLQLSDKEDVRHAARGALWEINQHVEGPNLNTNSAKLEVDCPHIMISYQWDSQSVMLKVKDRLKDAGYKVWMDVEHMTGSTLEAMALAVEKAAVVLIAMSQKYKDSPSCRSEAEYTYKLRKSFIPLRLQHRYVPDGWLGMLIGTRLYFDISSEDKINHQMDNIMKELGNRGKIGTHTDAVDGYTNTKQVNTAVNKLRYEDWSTTDISSWLSDNSVKLPTNIQKELDGPLLKELMTMQDRAPEHFYRLVQTDLGLEVIDMLRFSKLLRQLNTL